MRSYLIAIPRLPYLTLRPPPNGLSPTRNDASLPLDEANLQPYPVPAPQTNPQYSLYLPHPLNLEKRRLNEEQKKTTATFERIRHDEERKRVAGCLTKFEVVCLTKRDFLSIFFHFRAWNFGEKPSAGVNGFPRYLEFFSGPFLCVFTRVCFIAFFGTLPEDMLYSEGGFSLRMWISSSFSASASCGGFGTVFF